MRSTLYTRSITPEQKNLKTKDPSNKPTHITKPVLYNEKQQVAFLNKEIFSHPQRLANYNLKPASNEKNLKVKKVSPSPLSHNPKNLKPSLKVQMKTERTEKTPNHPIKMVQDQNNLFKYLLHHTPNKGYENSSVDSRKDEINQKTQIKKTKYIDNTRDYSQERSTNLGEKHYEQILEQIKQEKRVFYEKLNNINNRSTVNQNTFNDSITSNSFFKQKPVENVPEIFPNQILNSSEIEKTTLVKLLEELEKNKRTKEEDLHELTEKLEKQEQELSIVQKSHLELTENLKITNNDLKNENGALEAQIEKAQRNLKEQERNCRETLNLIDNYKQEINQITVSLHKKEKDSEKELSLLDLQITNESSRNIELTQKLENLQQTMKNNASIKEEYEKLQSELKLKNEEIAKLDGKKSELLSKQNEFKISSQEAIFKLKEELISKNQDLHQMKSQFDEFCKGKEKEKLNLQNELLFMESELAIIQKTKEFEQKEMQEKLGKIMKENEMIENELKLSEIEHEKKMKDIQKELDQLETKSKKVEEEIKSLDDLKRTLQDELNSSKKIFEDQIRQVERENLKLEEENQSLQKDIEKLKTDNFELERELHEEKKNMENSLDIEIKNVNKEIEDYKYLVDNLTKSKQDLEKEIEEFSLKLKEEKKKKDDLSSQEKDKIKVIAKLKNELQDLQKINEENNNLLKKMLEEKEQNEKELNDLNMLNTVFQKEMERNLETINEMSQKEANLNNKIKVLEAELKSKKKK